MERTMQGSLDQAVPRVLLTLPCVHLLQEYPCVRGDQDVPAFPRVQERQLELSEILRSFQIPSGLESYFIIIQVIEKVKQMATKLPKT